MQRGKLLAIERPFTHMFCQEFYKTSVSGFEKLKIMAIRMKYNLNSRNPNSLKPKVRSNYLGIKNITKIVY